MNQPVMYETRARQNYLDGYVAGKLDRLSGIEDRSETLPQKSGLRDTKYTPDFVAGYRDGFAGNPNANSIKSDVDGGIQT